MKIINILAIAVGASVGATLRFKLNMLLLHISYPIGTLIENILGSFLLGFLTAWFSCKAPKEWVKLGLGVGLCGAFTTFSTLASDTVALALAYHFLVSVSYVFVSMFGGILSALVGYLFGVKLWKVYKREMSH
ncbi:fluoride efflux transporter FluC [Metabacillus iocasae]|uniref:Fluoride-specific ion channel FluC n=1 Tax=Priestia iocasae TaxID=2291674 RepID=A0ABS2QTD7_9BACI|nr:CrcB family protein [Metabacillus iocasae]MBM7702726.1 CrcB protein [Metabacillus iocasae]